jgi:hypothetical protein
LDEVFITGVASFISAIIVFCGSVFLLLMFVMGPRLAYLVTASVTLAFVLIMGLVWSYGDPLGPVGQQADWNPVDIAEAGAALDFGPASQYPEGPWFVPGEDEESAAADAASELETAATDYLEAAIADEEVEGYESAGDAVVGEDSLRLLEQDGAIFGAITLEPVPVDPQEQPPGGLQGSQEDLPEPPDILVVMSFDPGNPSRPARLITAGTFLLFVAHLFGLSRAEKRSKKNGNGANGRA